MIQAIVFDFGGVLIDWNPRYVYKEIFNDDEKMEWFLSNVCTNEWNLEQDKGRPFAEGVAKLTESFPEYAEHINTFHSKWEQMLKGEITETVALLKELKKRHKVYGLTNWSAETFPIAFKRFDFLSLLDGIVVSGEERMIKPAKTFFQLLLDRYHLKAKNCVFIDDDEYNVAAANELGFRAIHFTSADNLKEVLISLQLIN
jgi:2-haloacid dehalogenase